jgi:outer membrane protein assembly factor BamB
MKKRKKIRSKINVCHTKKYKYYNYSNNNIFMIGKYYVIIVVLLLIFPATLSFTAESVPNNQAHIQIPTSCGNGYRYNIMGWVYVHIEGEPYERGYQYGYLASEEIVDMMVRWSNWGYEQKILKRLPMDKNSPRYDKVSELWWEYCKLKSKTFFLKHYPEEYIQEMRGVADGVRDRGGMIHGHPVEFDDILTTNEVVNCWFSYDNPKKAFNPLRGVLNGIKKLFSKEQGGSCSAFIATGDATTDGGIVFGHTTHIPKLYIPERFNIILDVKPSSGNRFILVGPPGTIHSMTDYYQNEKGILLMETTYYPQGPWKINGVPIGVRSRNAIQYSDSIDDVINYLKDGNNGLFGSEWLIGDTKTGEIASIELALYNTPVKRSYNDFYWSCNHPHNSKVESEIFGIPSILIKIVNKLFPDTNRKRVEKFKELEKELYGKIDTEIAKKILSTYPLCKPSSDGKITDSKLMNNLGFLAFMGNPNGTKWVSTDELKNKFKGITDLPAVGWAEIYPPISKPNTVLRKKNQYSALKEYKLLWQSKSDTSVKGDYSSITISDGVIFTGDSHGAIRACNLDGMDEIWKEKTKGKIIETSVSKELMYVSSDKSLYAINKNTGKIKWEQDVIRVTSKPVFTDDLVVISCSDGGVYAFDSNSGKKIWEHTFSNPAYLSEIKENSIYIGSGNTCYSFDVDSKKLVWEKKTDGPITAPPRVNGKRVFVGSWDGELYALDSNNGDVKWSYETGWGIDSTPYVSDDMVFVGSLDNNFYALDAETGNLKWYYTCKSAIHSSPVVYGEYVFFGCDDGRLYALNQEDGNLAWSFTPGYFLKNDANSYLTTAIRSDPYIEEGVVYIEAEGNVYALDTQTCEILERIVEEKPSAPNALLIILLVSLIIISLIIFYKYKSRK